MNYKKYYKEIKDQLSEFSEVIYFESMTEDQVIEIEKRIGQPIKPLYREYLLAFGMVQDAFETLISDLDSFYEDLELINSSLKGYLPIFSDLDLEDTIYLINNNDLQDDFIYKVEIDSNDKIGKIKKFKLFQKVIEDSILDLKKDYKDRCLNIDKVNNTKFNLSGDDFNNFVEVFKSEGLHQKSDWEPKYYPDNIFGDEVAVLNYLMMR